MKILRLILVVLAFLAAGVPVVAQSQVLAKEYVSPDRRFTIRFPDVPKESEVQLDTKIGPVVSHQIMLTTDLSYWLSFTDYPTNLENGDAVKATLDNARDGGLARVAKEEPRILSESDISLDGHPGRSLRVELKDDAILHLQIVLTDNRLYVLAVETPKGDLKKYDKIAAGFFDSFKITPTLDADVSANWREFSSTEGKYRAQYPGTPFRWTLPIESLTTTLHVASYYSSGQYSVMYFDYAQMPTDPAMLKKFLDDLNAGQLARAEQMGGKATVLSESEITVDGNPGRFMVTEIGGVLTYRVRTIVVKNRVYFVTSAMPKDDPKASDPRVYEKLSLKFLNSFNFTKDTVKP